MQDFPIKSGWWMSFTHSPIVSIRKSNSVFHHEESVNPQLKSLLNFQKKVVNIYSWSLTWSQILIELNLCDSIFKQ